MNPIAVLLGAGASFKYGVPMMREFYDRFAALVESRYPECVELLDTLTQDRSGRQPDLETLMTDLEAVLGIQTGLEKLGKDDSGVKESVRLARELRGFLDAFIIDTCERFDREFSAEVQLLLRLRELGPFWIFTTNYDRIIENACTVANVAYSDGFERGDLAGVGDWSGRFDEAIRVIKLHGSVNWYVGDPDQMLHRLDRGYALPAHDFRLTRGSQTLRPLMIIPTLEKQTTTEPYVELATHFADVLQEVRVLVVIGSSLRDDHIRGVIRTRMSRLHVVVVNPDAGSQVEILGQRQRTHSLSAGASEFYRFGTEAILKLGSAVNSGVSDEELGALLQETASRIHDRIAEESAWSASPRLLALRRDLDVDRVITRRDAVKALDEERHPAVTKRVVEILQGDASPEVRMAAVGALVRSCGVLSVEVLLQCARNDAALHVRREAVLALCSLLPDSDAHDAVADLAVEQPDPVLRKIIAEALNGSLELGCRQSNSAVVQPVSASKHAGPRDRNLE